MPDKNMPENTILFTTPTYPYPTLPANDSLTDATGQRFTKGDNLFTLVSHTHCFANHILAQNIEVPSILLEYPRWGDFTAEVDKGYQIIGISGYPVHIDRIKEMCLYIRKKSPQTKILLGSYAGQAFRAAHQPEEQDKYVDHVVHGEGVRFMRNMLGEEDIDRPIKQRLMPKAGGAPPFVNPYPTGNVGFLVSGLGCPGGCDFCSTTALFDHKRKELLSPEELVEHIALYHEEFPSVRQVFVIEEDHFRYPQYLHRMREFMLDHPEVLENLDWLAFGSIDHIDDYAKRYGWDALAEIGLGAIFIGVESKFAGEHGYDKRDESDAREVFNRLHSMGVRSLGAWICGWDFHNHGNMYEDLNYFVSLYPTYQQLTRLSPFPGTLLWDKLKEEGRVRDVPWEDVHFWSGAQVNTTMEPHETLNLTEYGYDLLYNTWGPSMLRRLDVTLNGYAYCMQSNNPIMRKHKAKFFKKQSALIWNLLYAMDRFAPNGPVRRRVRKIDEKYRRIIGEPTPLMQTLGKVVDGLATAYKIKDFFDPMNRNPKEEPFKKYIYSKNGAGNGNGNVPYETQWLTEPKGSQKAFMRLNEAKFALADKVLRAVRFGTWRKGDREIDDYLVGTIKMQNFVGF